MMPWKTDKDSLAHNRHAHGTQGEKWRKVANAILAAGGDDGKAVRVANAALSKHMGPAKRFGKKKPS